MKYSKTVSIETEYQFLHEIPPPPFQVTSNTIKRKNVVKIFKVFHLIKYGMKFIAYRIVI